MKYIMASVLLQSAVPDEVCDWKAVGAGFCTTSQAILYAPTLPAATSDAIDRMLSEMSSDLSLDSLKSQWFQDWPDCLPLRTSSWRPLAPQDFMILFIGVGMLVFVGLAYRLLGDFVLDVEMHPERHSGCLAGIARWERVKEHFGVRFEHMEKPFATHAAMLSKVMVVVDEVNARLRGADGEHGGRTEWVKQYNPSKGVFLGTSTS